MFPTSVNVLFEIAKLSPEGHRFFVKNFRHYRLNIKNPDLNMKYQVMDAWAGDKGYYIDEHGDLVYHGKVEMKSSGAECSGEDEQFEVYTRYFRNGKLHREDDQPAVSKKVGDRVIFEAWYVNGKLHRDGDKPAQVSNNCYCYMNIYGELHSDGVVMLWYYKEGARHRENDKPALIIYKQPNVCEFTETVLREEWYKHGKFHRENNMPACIDHQTGAVEYYVEHRLHRTDGPAFITAEGKMLYYLEGKQVLKSQIDNQKKFARLHKKRKTK